MMTAFLIATLVYFIVHLMLNILVIGLSISDKSIPPISIINLVVDLIMISFNIYMFATL